MGNNSVGSALDSGDAGYLNGSPFNSGAGGNLVSMSVHVGVVGAASSNLYQLAVYTDSAGAPGALVARTVSGSLMANAWNTLPISAKLASN